MPGPALTPPAPGFFGKLPSRGDFVRTGLPRDFTDHWDAWLRRTLPTTLCLAGDNWMEFPAWFFRLSAGLCGGASACGVVLPGVDRVGRRFPLTIACVGADVAPGLLATVEQIGRAAIVEAWAPDVLAKRLVGLGPADDQASAVFGRGLTVWSASTAPVLLPGLPDAADFWRRI